MVAPGRKLIVEIIGARNLVSIDGTGSASAFCTLDYDQNQKKTKTKNKDRSPTWGERFDFPYGDGLGVLDISVYNKGEGGTRRDGFLGRVQIKVPDVQKQGQEALQWLRLEKWSLFSLMHGNLGVKVWYEDQKSPTPEPKPQPNPELKEPPPPKETAPPKKDPKKSLVNTVTPADFKVKDIVRKTIEMAQPEYQHIDDQAEPMQYLYVKVLKARDLAAKGAEGTSDPYVEVSVSDFSAQTQVVTEDLNPEWNRVFAFAEDQQHGQFLEISVWDASMVGAYHFVGALSFLLEEIPARKPPEIPLAPLWYKLEERPGKIGVKGDLMMALWMGNQADEVFQDASYPRTGGHAHLRSKVYRTPNLWYLKVGVLEADLHTRDGRQPEPFVEINLGLVQTIRLTNSNAKLEGVKPVWNKDLMFVAAEPFEELLVITVKDRIGPNKEEVMGVARISIESVPKRLDFRQKMNSCWFNLETTTKTDDCGRIHLRLHFEGGYHVLEESPDYISCWRPTAEQLWKPSLGVLKLGVIGAKSLLPMHLVAGGRPFTDAYCVAKYGQKWFRTSTITDNYDPEWNEQHTWEVYDPCTVLTVCVFDNRHVHNEVEAKEAGVKDTPMGKVRIRLSTLEIDRVYTNRYPLLVITSSGVKKMGELELSIRFSYASTVNVMRAYLKPPLPALHYYVPIDSSDLEYHRRAAINLVASRLARFEHPLQQEVVKFILDAEGRQWSMRRSKANYFRIANVLGGLFALHKWFDDICRWKNPINTVLLHILLLILVWYPELRLTLVFSYLFTIGALNYRFRSRRPPFIDIQLNHGGEEPIIDFDELEEEFNLITSTEAEMVLKSRYERLRALSGRIQNVIGEAATQGERLQSLLSWRDPRATFIFATFCLIAAVVHYVTPFRVVAQVLIIFYVLRHPIFRDPFPPIALNFFRRLPSLSDLIL